MLCNVGSICATGSINQCSSSELKADVAQLDAATAQEAVSKLRPVTFRYKADPVRDAHAGFIAEESPGLVTTPDKKAISSMDVVAVLTKVVQEQQRTIRELEERLAALEAKSQEVESR